jgi:hypothetical protein
MKRDLVPSKEKDAREDSHKWPRWRQWNPDKGTYQRTEEELATLAEGTPWLGQSCLPEGQDEGLVLPKKQVSEDSTNKNETSTSTSSSSTSALSLPIVHEVDPGVYWDQDGVWEEWGGDWWKKHDDGWWEKWQQPPEGQ